MRAACRVHPRRRRVSRAARELERPRQCRFGRLSPGARLPRARAAGGVGACCSRRCGAARRDAGVPPAQFEGPLWQLVTSQPLHMLAQALCQLAVSSCARRSTPRSRTLRRAARSSRAAPGGHATRCSIRHPLSRALPVARRRCSTCRRVELPGDHDMPRVQNGRLRRLRTLRRLAGSRERGLSPHARRAERASALALLPRRLHGVGRVARRCRFCRGRPSTL